MLKVETEDELGQTHISSIHSPRHPSIAMHRHIYLALRLLSVHAVHFLLMLLQQQPSTSVHAKVC